MPNAGDMRGIMAIPIIPRSGSNPLGVKGIGEPSSAAVAPAIISAVNDALGIKIRDLPAAPEKTLAAMEARK
jgi:CO/xanthine dehydrogenase Mo-binding subunit